MAEEKKDTFVFYRSFFEAMKSMDEYTDGEKFQLCQAIFVYGLDHVIVELPKRLQFIFDLIKPQLEANWIKYENGKRGGAPRGNKNAKKTT